MYFGNINDSIILKGIKPLYIPDQITSRFKELTRLDIPSRKGHAFFTAKLNSGSSQPSHFIKCVPYTAQLLSRLEALTSDFNATPVLNIPNEFLRFRNEIWIISNFVDGQNLAESISEPKDTSIQPLIDRQIVQGLCQILKELEEFEIVHFDIKPSNIIVISNDNEIERLTLIDFDSAIKPSLPHRNYTPSYASPQKLNPNSMLSTRDNSWAAGVVLYEWISKRKVFANVSNDVIVQSINATWHPAYEHIEQDHYRGLIAGLCDRDENLRFSSVELNCWLQGEVNAVIRGLRQAGLDTANSPFRVNGNDCFTLQALGSQLIFVSQRFFEENESLIQWLNTEVAGGQQLIARFQDIASSNNFEEDRLSLCLDLFPEMPLIWNQERLTEHNIAAICQLVSDGNASQREEEFLEELITEAPYRFYETRERFEIREIKTKVYEAYQSYLDARNLILANQQSVEEENSDSVEYRESPAITPIAQVIYAFINTSAGNFVTERSKAWFEPSSFLHRHSWFFCLGTDALSLPQIIALNEFERDSLTNMEILSDVNQYDSFRRGDFSKLTVITRHQSKLLKRLKVLPNSKIRDARSPENIVVHDEDYDPFSLRDWFRETAVYLFFRDLRRWLNDSMSNLFRRLDAIINRDNSLSLAPELLLRIDYVPLTHKWSENDSSKINSHKDNAPCGLLLKIYWEALPGERIQLKAKRPSFLNPKSLFSYSVMPRSNGDPNRLSAGNFSFVALENLEIQLTATRSFFRPTRRAKMYVESSYFRKESKLTKVNGKINRPEKIAKIRSLDLTPSFNLIPNSSCDSIMSECENINKDHDELIKLNALKQSSAQSIDKVWLQPEVTFIIEKIKLINFFNRFKNVLSNKR